MVQVGGRMGRRMGRRGGGEEGRRGGGEEGRRVGGSRGEGGEGFVDRVVGGGWLRVVCMWIVYQWCVLRVEVG